MRKQRKNKSNKQSGQNIGNIQRTGKTLVFRKTWLDTIDKIGNILSSWGKTGN